MSLAITHFAVGAGVMLLLQPLLFPNLRYRRSLVVASGLWALVPDVFYVVPGLADVFVAEFAAYGNVFWFHTYMDGIVMGRGTRPNAALALVFLTACAIAGDVLSPRETPSVGSAGAAAGEPVDAGADVTTDTAADGSTDAATGDPAEAAAGEPSARSSAATDGASAESDAENPRRNESRDEPRDGSRDEPRGESRDESQDERRDEAPVRREHERSSGRERDGTARR